MGMDAMFNQELKGEGRVIESYSKQTLILNQHECNYLVTVTDCGDDN